MGDGRNQDGAGRRRRREGTTNWRIDQQKKAGSTLSLSLSSERQPDIACLVAVRQAECCFFSSRLMPPPVDSINLVSLLGKRERERLTARGPKRVIHRANPNPQGEEEREGERLKSDIPCMDRQTTDGRTGKEERNARRARGHTCAGLRPAWQAPQPRRGGKGRRKSVAPEIDDLCLRLSLSLSLSLSLTPPIGEEREKDGARATNTISANLQRWNVEASAAEDDESR